VNDIAQTVNHFIFVDFNSQFTPAVKAARSQIEDPKQDEEKGWPAKAEPGFGRDQLDDSRVRRFRSAISTTAHCSAVVTLRNCNRGGDEHRPRIRPIETGRDYQSCNL
jgi:hypothetical protein